MRRIWIAIVQLLGWKFHLPEQGSRPEIQRCVFAVAPHTAISDFLIGAAYLWALDVNGHLERQLRVDHLVDTLCAYLGKPLLDGFGLLGRDGLDDAEDSFKVSCLSPVIFPSAAIISVGVQYVPLLDLSLVISTAYKL